MGKRTSDPESAPKFDPDTRLKNGIWCTLFGGYFWKFHYIRCHRANITKQTSDLDSPQKLG